MKKIISAFLSLIMLFIITTGLDFSSFANVSQGEWVSTDTLKTGDTFQMGMYPQSEVTDDATISALSKIDCTMTNYAYLQNSNADNYTYDTVDMYYGDFWYNGNKYRKVTINSYRFYNTVMNSSNGKSHQSENGYNTGNTYYFIWEPIVWQVLRNNDGGAYVMSKKTLDAQSYNNYYESTTWEACSLRYWLNHSFFNSAFSIKEKENVITVTLNNENNPNYGTSGGNDTTDSIWILSYRDAINNNFGFSSDSETADKARRVQGSDYAKSQGLLVKNNNDYHENSGWWLRTSGYKTGYACVVNYQGYSCGNDIVHSTIEGIRPAFKLNSNAEVYKFNTVFVNNGIYNLGDETYSFGNYSDSDSNGGHCFGMSMTSSGYYIGKLNRSIIGVDANKNLFSFSKTDAVRKPICHYQAIQGSFANQAIVAGGCYYLYHYNNIASDWNAVVNYVKNHNYDKKGTLQVGFRQGEYGHAVNFLYYKEVDGQQRIYMYDNNFPYAETYLYKDTDGNVYQKPYSTFSGSIDCIALRDVAKYYQAAGNYKASNCVYAENGKINISGSVYVSQMDCNSNGVEYMMYELPDNVKKVKVVPTDNNSKFTYLNNTFDFGKTDDITYGILYLADSDSGTIDDCGFVTVDSQGKETCKSHKVVKDKAVAATFKKAGKTAGKHCSVCGKVITAQKTVSKLGTPKLSKVKAGKKAFTATWTKANGVAGYQVQYSLKKNFKGAKTKKLNKTKLTVKKLKSKKIYYVRVRAYKKINGKMQYSKWSVKKVKVK